MKKSRVIFTIMILVLILASFVLAKVFSDLKKEKRIENEIKEVVRVLGTENIDDDDVNAILERRIFSKGNYHIVEDALKNYYKDLYNYQKNIAFLMDDDNFITYLSSKNIVEDGPTFTKSISNLQTNKSQLADKYNEFEKQLKDESTQISYIFDKNVDSYYKKYYLECISEYTPSSLETDIKDKYEETLKKIDLYNEAFAFLTANEAHWRITDDVITFDDTTLYEGYKAITDKIDKMKQSNQQTS
ncbi:MAG: hypothetical protein II625_06985 [Bacilli bacterium]|nr:hypothetical protein [Bacilli bacterium]